MIASWNRITPSQIADTKGWVSGKVGDKNVIPGRKCKISKTRKVKLPKTFKSFSKKGLSDRKIRSHSLIKHSAPEAKTKLYSFKGRGILKAFTLGLSENLIGLKEYSNLKRKWSAAKSHDKEMLDVELDFAAKEARLEVLENVLDSLNLLLSSGTLQGETPLDVLSKDLARIDNSYDPGIGELINIIQSEGGEKNTHRLLTLINHKEDAIDKALLSFSENVAGDKTMQTALQKAVGGGINESLEMIRGKSFDGDKPVRLFTKLESKYLGRLTPKEFAPASSGPRKFLDLAGMQILGDRYTGDKKAKKKFDQEVTSLRTRNYEKVTDTFMAHKMLMKTKVGVDVGDSVTKLRQLSFGVKGISSFTSFLGASDTATGGLSVGLNVFNGALFAVEAVSNLKDAVDSNSTQKKAKAYVRDFSMSYQMGRLGSKNKKRVEKGNNTLDEFLKLEKEEDRAKFRDLGAVARSISSAKAPRGHLEDAAYHGVKAGLATIAAVGGATIIGLGIAGVSTGYGAPIAVAAVGGASLAVTAGYISYKGGKAAHAQYKSFQSEIADKLLNEIDKYRSEANDILKQEKPPESNKKISLLDKPKVEEQIKTTGLYQSIKLDVIADMKLEGLSDVQKDALTLSVAKRLILQHKLGANKIYASEAKKAYKSLVDQKSAKGKIKHAMHRLATAGVKSSYSRSLKKAEFEQEARSESLGADEVKSDLSKEDLAFVSEAQDEAGKIAKLIIREKRIESNKSYAIEVFYDGLIAESKEDFKGNTSLSYTQFIKELGVKDDVVKAVIDSSDSKIAKKLLTQILMD